MKQVVEYQGVPVGVLIPGDGSLAFMAVKYNVIELDGKAFCRQLKRAKPFESM